MQANSSTRLQCDGSSSGEQESLPFGTTMGAGISGNNRRFTSYDRSTTTKLDYAVNRSYNAGLGRFTQVNPIGDPQSQATTSSSRIQSRSTQ
jgi:RHS repeat-associated protein